MKLTNKAILTMVNEVLATVEHDHKSDMMATIEKMIEQIDKKADGKGLTKAQKENLVIKYDLGQLLAKKGSPMSISQIQAIPQFAEFSNQKLSALLNQMVKDGKLEKSISSEKKTIFQSLEVVEIEEEVEEIVKPDLSECMEKIHEYANMLNSLHNLENKKVG